VGRSASDDSNRTTLEGSGSVDGSGRRLVIPLGESNSARAIPESGNASTTVSASTIGSTGWNDGFGSSQLSVRVMRVMLAS